MNKTSTANRVNISHFFYKHRRKNISNEEAGKICIALITEKGIKMCKPSM
jgi:hypothetical protein